MSLRRRDVAPTPRPVADTHAWVWSALSGLRELKVADTDMMAALLGKRKAEDPPPPPSREASNESNSSDGSADADDAIQMIVLNFDGTMTRAKPFMRDPTLFEASKGFITTESLRGFAEMTEEEHVANFGGAQDVAALKEFFEECREAGIKIYVICDGKAKAANYALKEVGLHGLVTGVVGSTDPPFDVDPEIGKYAAVKMLMRMHNVSRTQVLWVASKTPDVQSVAELGVASLQIEFDDGLVKSGLDDMRYATGLLNEAQLAQAEQEKGVDDVDGMQDFLA